MAGNKAGGVRPAKWLFLSGFLIVFLLWIDQYTKALAVDHLKEQKDILWIPGILRFSYVENPGMAWGMLSGKTMLFILFTLIVMCVLVVFVIRLSFLNSVRRKVYMYLQLDLTVLIAGALGNLVDRIKNGYVVDFIMTDFIDFPVFNVADCYVTISVAILFLMLLFVIKDEELDAIISFSGSRKNK